MTLEVEVTLARASGRSLRGVFRPGGRATLGSGKAVLRSATAPFDSSTVLRFDAGQPELVYTDEIGVQVELPSGRASGREWANRGHARREEAHWVLPLVDGAWVELRCGADTVSMTVRPRTAQGTVPIGDKGRICGQCGSTLSGVLVGGDALAPCGRCGALNSRSRVEDPGITGPTEAMAVVPSPDAKVLGLPTFDAISVADTRAALAGARAEAAAPAPMPHSADLPTFDALSVADMKAGMIQAGLRAPPSPELQKNAGLPTFDALPVRRLDLPDRGSRSDEVSPAPGTVVAGSLPGEAAPGTVVDEASLVGGLGGDTIARPVVPGAVKRSRPAPPPPTAPMPTQPLSPQAQLVPGAPAAVGLDAATVPRPLPAYAEPPAGISAPYGATEPLPADPPGAAAFIAPTGDMPPARNTEDVVVSQHRRLAPGEVVPARGRRDVDPDTTVGETRPEIRPVRPSVRPVTGDLPSSAVSPMHFGVSAAQDGDTRKALAASPRSAAPDPPIAATRVAFDIPSPEVLADVHRGKAASPRAPAPPPPPPRPPAPGPERSQPSPANRRKPEPQVNVRPARREKPPGWDAPLHPPEEGEGDDFLFGVTDMGIGGSSKEGKLLIGLGLFCGVAGLGLLIYAFLS